MNRDAWIASCAVEFERRGAARALDLAATEFNIRCRTEPFFGAPELDASRWPEPADAAISAVHEYASLE